MVVYNKNIENKEKKVDMKFRVSIVDTIHLLDPGILLLISSNDDYLPAIL
ncbi:8740_t:CDS:2 [Funneliformis mosseae]|uniref:8740_t:CDS:1 n=1 Tax=Funneliformis mosseae TaxID=27381 RepID=A0A9N9E8Y0_FUNMO|nr:8740_t:CDS:2 [Funneliformis mosseae]